MNKQYITEMFKNINNNNKLFVPINMTFILLGATEYIFCGSDAIV